MMMITTNVEPEEAAGVVEASRKYTKNEIPRFKI